LSTPDRKAYFALGFVCLVWGISWVCTKEAVKYVPVFQMVGIRQLIAGSIFVLYFIYKREKFPNKKQWRMIFILSVLNFIISQGLSTFGVKLTTAGLGAIIGAIFPLWLVLIITVRGKTKLPPMTWIGLLIGFIGVCVVFYEHLHLEFTYTFLGGIMLGLIASVTWAFGTIHTRDFALDYNPYFSIGWQMLIAGVVLTSVSTATGDTIPLMDISAYAWAVILFLTFISSIFAFLAYLYALQRLPTDLVSIYAYINPIVAVLTGALLIGEPLTILIITGSAITLVGVYIVNKAVLKNLRPKLRIQ
jgi:drug/metabolite transporter (DMT)-like permease